ncbi:hypothetical protein NQZ68_002062 [Dissostichus eleginoides]|nr:hypothetical protein NQZ68_002062 [Dissostichus eleginoides]
MMFTSPTPPDFALERSMPSAPGQFTALKEQKYASAPKETLGSNNSVLPEAPNEISGGCFSGGSPEFPAAALTMTKLLEWLLGVSLVLAAWAVVSFDLLELRLPQSYREAAWPMPLYLLVSFGCYSLGTVGYRVATFNDCDEASAELLGQIEEAKQDLRKKGLKI